MCTGWKVENKIACDECGYPQSEAKYSSLEDYNKYRASKKYPQIFECGECGCILSEGDDYVTTKHEHCCEACSDNLAFEEEDSEDCWCGEQPPSEEEFKVLWDAAVKSGDTRSFEDFCIDWF